MQCQINDVYSAVSQQLTVTLSTISLLRICHNFLQRSYLRNGYTVSSRVHTDLTSLKFNFHIGRLLRIFSALITPDLSTDNPLERDILSEIHNYRPTRSPPFRAAFPALD